MKITELFPKEQFPIRMRSIVEFTNKSVRVIGITEIYLDRPLVCPYLEHGMQTKFGIIKHIITPMLNICFGVLFRSSQDIIYFAPVDNETFAQIPANAQIFDKYREIVGPGNEGLPLSGTFDSPKVNWIQF